MSRTAFSVLTNLSPYFEEGEFIAVTAAWNLAGKDYFAIATSLNRMFLLRAKKSGRIEIAGPLEFSSENQA